MVQFRCLTQHLKSIVFLVGVFGFCLAHAKTLNMAISDVLGFYPARVAIEQGFFAKEGLTVNVVPCINGKQCLKHLTDGKADLSATADLPLVFAAHQDLRFEVLATMCTSVKDNVFVVKTSAGIKTPKDLTRKKFGSVIGTTSHYFTDTFLSFYGIEFDAAERVPVDPKRVIDQAKAGAFDAAGLYEPLASEFLAALGPTWSKLSAPRLYTANFNLVATPVLDDETALRALRAIHSAIEYTVTHREAALVPLQKPTDVVAPTPVLMPENYDCALKLSQSLLSTLEAQSRWVVREKLVTQTEVPNYLNYVRTGPLKKLDKRSVSLIK